ncbi:hypothetical protein EON64_21065 [archaeon]|nr:MAG: hypothetical protein EON64_21065 [archaeon]
MSLPFFPGITTEQRAAPQVVKKLKLVGYPKKIYKNTAFIHGMFTSELEVSKFEKCKIRTVSGTLISCCYASITLC